LNIREVWHKEMIEHTFDWYDNSQIRHFEEFFKPGSQQKDKIKPESDDDKIAMIKKDL
jgi:hypothetical protein